jgi:hypothetical protein
MCAFNKEWSEVWKPTTKIREAMFDMISQIIAVEGFDPSVCGGVRRV